MHWLTSPGILTLIRKGLNADTDQNRVKDGETPRLQIATELILLTMSQIFMSITMLGSVFKADEIFWVGYTLNFFFIEYFKAHGYQEDKTWKQKFNSLMVQTWKRMQK